MMERLWAPWRMEYLKSDHTEGCIFCEKPGESRDQENYILHRGRRCYILLNIYPYTNGHLMVVPYEHLPSLEDLDDETLAEMMHLIRKGLTLLRRAVNPSGFNVGVNIGKAAGAGFDDHVHVHIVPRWHGDTNFMPVLTGTRVMPELLDDTYDQLLDAMQEEWGSKDADHPETDLKRDT